MIIEKDGDAWGAWVPDLPGCVAAGSTRAEVERLIAEAIPLHIEALVEAGEQVPPPTSAAAVVEVPAA
ncbi:MAG TPA: type II toxin-antitoxin system HicB family antitoxin [Solirubrobacteraceae bacterium]